ncbi:hypothetical protein MESS4_750218 [Mesorhizobium sp. STM 4661]|nr:hypothetical protein MESS4_750218 [Mesorhizobium sp. STM 4661]
MGNAARYEIHAVRYGHFERRSNENFLGGDTHDVAMPLDYFVWAIVGEKRTDRRQAWPQRGQAGRRWSRRHRHRSCVRKRRDHFAHALRPLRQSSLVSERDLPPAGCGDGIRDGPLHVPSRDEPSVRSRGRHHHGPACL